MADLNGKLGQVGSAVILVDAAYPLTALNEAMKAKIAKTITPKQGYLSKFEVIEELRNRLHDDYRTKPPTGSLQQDFDAVKVNLDKQKPMLDIAKVSSSFDPLEKYMETLVTSHGNIFNPPLLSSFKTDLHDVVYSIPNVSKNDIRRYGRVIVFDKFEKVVYDWLLNNSPLFGFLLYEDFGLFYLSVPEVKKLVTSKTVEKTLNKFQRVAVSGSIITLTAAAVEAAQQPVPPPPPPPPSGGGGAKTVVLSTGLSNNFNDLTNIEKQFKFLQTKGCKVFVIGVSNDPPSSLSALTQQSTKMQALVTKYNFTYCGDFTPSNDKIHPDYGSYYNSNVKPKIGGATVDIIVGDSISAGVANAGFGMKRSGANKVKSPDSKGISMVGANPAEVLGFLNELDSRLTAAPAPQPINPSGGGNVPAATGAGSISYMKQAGNAVFKNSGKDARCAQYTYNIARDYILALRGKPVKGLAESAGGNANDASYRTRLQQLGYTMYPLGTLTKQQLIEKINGQWNVGDIINYKSTISGTGGNDYAYIYGHTQIYTGRAIDIGGKRGGGSGNSPWASSWADNYGAGFVYNSKASNSWEAFIFRAPTT